jgi:hypothetical protein
MNLPMRALKFLGLIGLLAIIAGIGAAAFFLGGFFNVGANHRDPGIVNWALVHVRKASIARHATEHRLERSTIRLWYGLAQAPTRSAAASIVTVGLE